MRLQHEHVVSRTLACSLALSLTCRTNMPQFDGKPPPFALPLPLPLLGVEQLRGQSYLKRVHLLGAALVACETRMREHRERKTKERRHKTRKKLSRVKKKN